MAMAMLAATAFGQNFPAPVPPDPQVLALIPYDEAPTDPERLREMKDAGLNIAGFCRPQDVAAVKAAGMSCFVQFVPLAGYDWHKPPAAAQVREDIGRLQRQFASEPAVLGFYLADEPQTRDLPAVGSVVHQLRAAMPDKIPFVNLFPYREGQAEWYTSYEDYVRALADVAQVPLLSFDNYSLTHGGMGDEFFVNLEIVRKVALEKHLPFWTCVQAVAHFGYQEPTVATLQLQVFSALAYGARGIEYFTYFTPERGNYRAGAIDPFGRRTATWEALRRVNGQIHALGPVLARLHSTGVFHFPDVPKQGHALSESRIVRHITMVKDEDQYVAPSVAARFLVGELQDAQGRPYLMIVNKDLVYSFQFEIDWRMEPRRVLRVNPYSGAEEPFEGEQNWVGPGGAVLLRLDANTAPH